MVNQPKNTKRIFLGFSFEATHLELFKKINGELKERGVQNLTKLENLHITLAFLGNVEEERLSWTFDQLNTFDFSAFQPKFYFKDLSVKINNKKVMLWARFSPNKDAQALHAQIHQTLSLKPDHRFVPHVTFCRARKDQTTINKNQFQNLKVPDFKPFQVSLFESFITKGGVKYESLESYYLK